MDTEASFYGALGSYGGLAEASGEVLSGFRTLESRRASRPAARLSSFRIF